MKPIAFRPTALAAALLLPSLVQAVPAVAPASFFSKDATINSPVNGNVYVGFASSRDYATRTNPTSPTINVVSGASLTGALYIRNNSTVNLRGGGFHNVIYVSDSGKINIYGADITISYTKGNGDSARSEYRLSGKLSDGSSLNGTVLSVQKGSHAQVQSVGFYRVNVEQADAVRNGEKAKEELR